MNAVAGAAVLMFCSLDSPAWVPCDVVLRLSLHSSPSPSSLKKLNLSARRCKSRRRRGIAEAAASSFSTESDDEEEEFGYRNAGAEGSDFSGERKGARSFAGEESARAFEVSHSWVFQKQHTRGVQSSDRHREGGSLAYSRGSDVIPHEEQQHHASFVGKKLSIVPLPTKNQHLRMHNKVSAFESIRQPFISGHSPRNYADVSSWGVEDADVAPNLNREAPPLHEGSGHRPNQSRFSTRYENKENVQKGTKFMSKMEEILSSIKKKDDLLRKNLAMNQKALREESTLTRAEQGLQTATCEGKKAEESRVDKSSESSEKGNAKSINSHIERSANYVNRSASEDYRSFSLMNHRKHLQSEPGEARSSLKENTSMDNEAGVATFNLFSSSPAVPWKADRKYESPFKPGLSIRREMRPSARRSFRSIGSRSSPSRPSNNSRNVYHSKLESHATTSVIDPPKLAGGAEQVESGFDIRERIVFEDNKSTPQTTSLMELPKADTQTKTVNFEWIETNAEENNDNALSIHQNPEEITAKALASASILSSLGDSKVNEENDVLIKLDAVHPEIDSLNRSYHNMKISVDAGDLRIEDAKSPAFDSSERSLHNMKERLPSSMTHSNATPADFRDKVTLGTSEMSNGSKYPHSASWHKHDNSDLPFDFQFSYSETPKAPILGYRENPYSPFGPTTMDRPWIGVKPPNPSKKKKRVFDSFNPPPKDKRGVKYVEDPGPYLEGQGPKPAKSREEILGEPLTKEEIIYLVEKCERESRQLNLGRDGLTHNMLDLIHCHWKRRRVCRIKCKGVPTLDMDNVKFHIEDKTQGKIIYQAGGVLYLFRGRNYNYKDRPQIPLMIWKPPTPVYPKLIQSTPEGLTKEEAQRLRALGRKVQPMCRLGKNGVYLNLVEDIRAAFKMDELVRIDCQGLYPRDYKKIGGKLKDLVPCVLLSFDKDCILLWRGKQDLSIENCSLSTLLTLEPHHPSEEILNQSPIAHEENDHSVCEGSSDISAEEASCSDHSVCEESLDILAEEASCSAHVSEGETQEKSQQSSSERELGSRLDYTSQEFITHSSDARAPSVLEIADEQVQSRHLLLSSSTTDEGHALTDTGETKYNSSSKSLKEENSEVSLANSLLMGDEILLQSAEFLPESHATTDREPQQKTESEGLDPVFEEMSNSVVSKLEEDDCEGSMQLEAEDEGEFGLVSDEEEVKECLDDQIDDDDDVVVRLDELWDHACSSGMAVELSGEGMDADLIVREAAQLAELAPLGPTYTIKLRHKLQIKKYVQRPDNYLYVPFGRGRPRKMPKKAVKRKPQLPTLDVPTMGGLPVDKLAMLLASTKGP